MFTIEIRIRNHADAGTHKLTVATLKTYDALLKAVETQLPDLKEDYNLLMATGPSVSLDFYDGTDHHAKNGTPFDIGHLRVFPYQPELLTLIQKQLDWQW